MNKGLLPVDGKGGMNPGSKELTQVSLERENSNSKRSQINPRAGQLEAESNR